MRKYTTIQAPIPYNDKCELDCYYCPFLGAGQCLHGNEGVLLVPIHMQADELDKIEPHAKCVYRRALNETD